MKRIFFHQNGKLFTNFKAIYYGRLPVNVKDNLAGDGYFSFQVNVFNPKDPLLWEQNVLVVSGPKGDLPNKLGWGSVVGLVSQEVTDYFDGPIVTEFFSVTLEISGYKMIIDVQDIIANKQLLHQEWASLNRIDFLAAEAAIVGYSNGSIAMFTPDPNPNINDNFYVQVYSTDGDLAANILDSDNSFEQNQAAMTIGGINLASGNLTAESSNLSAELLNPNTMELKPNVE